MPHICIAFLMFVGIIYAIRTKCVSNLLSVYCFYWSLIVFLASIELFGMIEVSWKPYFLIFWGSVGFVIGYLFGNSSRKKNTRIGKKIIYNANVEEYTIRYNLAYTILLIVLAFYLYSLMKVVLLLLRGIDYSAIRTMMLHGGEGNIERFYTNAERLFSDYITVPSVFICIPLALLSMIKRNHKKSFVALALVDLALYVICTGSRIILASVVTQLIYLMIIYRITIPKKIVKKIKTIIMVAGVAIVIITFMRKSDYWDKINYTIYQSYYSYICLCVPLFDTWLDIIDKNHYITYGLASLKPFLSIPDVFLRQVGISNLDSYYYTINILNATEEYFRIFDNKNYNAFVTMFFYFYLDFREIGVFLGSMFYGRLCGRHYRRVKINNNLKNTLVFMLLLQGFIKMLVRWEFSINNYLLAFLLCVFFLKPVNNNDLSERT